MIADVATPSDTVALPGPPRALASRRIRVEVVRGPDRGRSAASEGSELSVGTADANHLVLSDPTISRHHLTVEASRRGLFVKDLGSTNGTFVGGFRVESVYLRSGTLVTLGQTSIRVDTGEELREALSVESRFGPILGRSEAMRRIFALLPRLAVSESTVLLEGETGTGKGLVAQCLHQFSRRASSALVVVDCGAIPPSLIESELFGHEKGAFTGAHQARVGALEAAQGGTLFLDEVGDLPLEMQPKLLRALEERVIKRIGSVDPIRLDIRVVAATNRDLRREVNRGSFRPDLFYRLHVVRLKLPPLRQRQEDIPLLLDHFYRQFARDAAEPEPPADMIADFCRREWPGNVRELRAAVERALLAREVGAWWETDEPAEEGASSSAPAPGSATPGSATGTGAASEPDAGLSFRDAKERVVSAWERSYVESLVRRYGGNLTRAARAAQMDRNHLRDLVRRYQVVARAP